MISLCSNILTSSAFFISFVASRSGVATITVFFLPQGGVGLTAAEADLSGRHLERLPTALFSSLHLTSINLSHNLLSFATSSAKRRCLSHTRKKRERRRRAGPPECREASGARTRQPPLAIRYDTHHPSGKTGERPGEEERPSVGLGVASDRVEENCQRNDQEKLPVKTSLKQSSFIDELENKLSQRKVANESCPEIEVAPAGAYAEETQLKSSNSRPLDSSRIVKDANTEITASIENLTQSSTPPLTKEHFPAALRLPQGSSSTGSTTSTSSTNSRWKQVESSREEGSRSSYDDSGSSCVDESDSGGSEAEEAAVEGGEVRAASSRSLGTLNQLRYFQQLQVCRCPSRSYFSGGHCLLFFVVHNSSVNILLFLLIY